ncbi:RNA polymerase sigma-70 factor [Flavivirga aquimarina]|uniref:RNA polymerase sigma-70 factor n=1 Tax=Flavivirga aquimarina TaxID=2027862 RepID=A0ABT8WB83_9FLAO|nr:RNA polymerase sigma-70 factor [Flavivirga aquimarina]MDO5970366.1 RNA polymerase sigma-70 factor [Flavivirga aquimarina]
MDDRLLWEKIQNNDQLAFKSLFDSYYKPLFSSILQYTYSIPEAEDIVQDVFIKLWIKRETVIIKTSLKSYLFRSAYNTYIDKYRKQKIKNNLVESLKYDTLLTLLEEDDSEFKLKAERIKKIVETLPKRCKEILLLSKQEGYKNKEISKILKISIKTVESQLSIAYKKIRKGFF